MGKLKPCPFCGVVPVLFFKPVHSHGDHRTHHCVWCHSTECTVQPTVTVISESGYEHDDLRIDEEARELAISRWNTRSKP